MSSEIVQCDYLAYRDPPHVEAAIGPNALSHRAEILDRLLPQIRKNLLEYEVVLRCCFFDETAKIEAMKQLGDVLTKLGQVNAAMISSSFTAGEA